MMRRKGRRSGRSLSMPAGVGMGSGCGLLLTLACGAALAWLVLTERIGEEVIGWYCMLIQFVSAATGVWLARRKVRHRDWLVSGLTVGAYYLMLLSMAMLFGAGLTGLGTTALVVGAGGVIGRIIGLFPYRSGVRRQQIRAFR